MNQMSNCRQRALPSLPRDPLHLTLARLRRLIDRVERRSNQRLHGNVSIQNPAQTMRSRLCKLPSIAMPSRPRFGSARYGRCGSQILPDRNQLRQPRVGRVCRTPSSVQQPRDSDEVSDGLSREGARHLSKEQPSRAWVKRALTLLVRTRTSAPG